MEEDIEINIVNKRAVLIGTQLVVEVDKETFERVLKERDVDDEYDIEDILDTETNKRYNEKQLYIDKASICLTCKS